MFLNSAARPSPTRVLITGCSSGTGRVLATEMAQRGYEVLASARDVSSLAGLNVAQTLQLDLTDPASIERAVHVSGRVDVLVNNAGFGLRAPAEVAPLPTVRDLFDVSYFGPLALLQALLPGMRKQGWGVVANLTSGMAGLVVRPFNSFYAAAKIALETLSEGLSYEVEEFGIRVVIIQPGTVSTPFRSKMIRPPDLGAYTDNFTGVERWRGVSQKSETRSTIIELVDTIIRCIEAEDCPLRVPVGADAVESLARRRSQTDDQFREIVKKEYISPDH